MDALVHVLVVGYITLNILEEKESDKLFEFINAMKLSCQKDKVTGSSPNAATFRKK
jgi:hypothetical protein